MHLVETMAYTGQTPWHGLGNHLAPGLPSEVWAEQAGMNWRIEESPVQFTAKAGKSKMSRAFPQQKVLYRSDTQAPLSVVSSRYQVVQPAEILEFYQDLTEVGGFELESAGVLKEGRKFWALARTGQSVRLKRKDEVNGYLLLATACDGTLATTAQFTSIRVVCNNTLAIALGQSEGAVKVPHRSSFDAQAVKRQLGIATSSWDDFIDHMKALAECKVSEKAAEAFLRSAFSNSAQAQPENSTNDRAIKAVHDLFSGHGQGSTLASAQGTAWGLLNSVTEFVDHHRRARSADHRRDAAWFGPGSVLKQKAWEGAMRLIA